MRHLLDGVVCDISFKFDGDVEPVVELGSSLIDQKIAACCFFLEIDQFEVGHFRVVSSAESVSSLLLIVEVVYIYFDGFHI